VESETIIRLISSSTSWTIWKGKTRFKKRWKVDGRGVERRLDEVKEGRSQRSEDGWENEAIREENGDAHD
jgi:hypothetical protein